MQFMHALSVDLQNELDDLAAEARLLHAASRLYDSSSSGDPVWKWLAVQGLASGIEKIYTGCERVMTLIASDVDQAKIAKSEGWHSQLLKRMANPYPGVRKAVISENTYRMMDRLRSFRHRERNSYGSALDADIVLQRARETDNAFAAFRSDVMTWLSQSATDKT